MTTFIPALTLPHQVFENAAASILLPIALGTAVGFSSRPKDTKKTYAAIKNPPGRPPAWVFGPAWTLLYGLMGYSAYRAFHTGLSPTSTLSQIADTKHGATLYTIQLGLNLIWMPLFFLLKRPVAATVDILALLGINSYLAYLWGSVDAVAGACLVPYLGWLSFATYLCAGAGYLNDWDLKGAEARYEAERAAKAGKKQ
ncbi:TspO/MBR family protein [Colletotrichum abscissum]|uniref:TspO/MBR family protein n=2 Tax=Colletotrichum acutatum species complex TaxID=2707335 RepID=A0A9P9XMK3_9PEZI|nr:TspO/MBR family protein [Colletotrichum tamarilloi]XP_060390554.1 TspO/MBR family protein [Colletotrichum abscissum]KAK1711302.1 TspO/MBR family protein [Colletotrichum lupini]KAI3556206.1 TspO/MBR family protein [Colletotrichum abscissum]KAK1473676.1 TspO/MBR family protein [Colletotrichum abscissum]KAK1512979.1 TspO/MBR family protein [Colletotrichum tamarilloi]